MYIFVQDLYIFFSPRVELVEYARKVTYKVHLVVIKHYVSVVHSCRVLHRR